VSFTQPLLLLLLLTIPLAAWIARARLMRRPRGQRAALDRSAFVALAVRSVLLASLIFALAGAQAVQYSDKLAVVFLIDASDSIGGRARSTAIDWVRNALAAMRRDGADEAAVVVFGRDAQVERALSAAQDVPSFGARVRSGGTDVEGALRTALALLPEGAARRVVLLSDGRQTTGDAAVAARLLRTANAQLDVVRLPAYDGPDAAVERVDAPQRATLGRAIPLRIVVRTSRAQTAALTVFVDGAPAAQQDVPLLAGHNEFDLAVRAATPGFTTLRVQIAAPLDALPQNDALSAAVFVEGPPRLLVVRAAAGEADESAEVRRVLESAGFLVEATPAGAMPSEIASLSSYAAVLLVDVPARELSERAMLALQSYVRDVGGGLVVVGGPRAYGVGGYFRTPLEETLPVDVQIKDPRRFPALSIVLVMDKSGSMSTTENGVLKMRLASEAAARVAELVKDEDEVTVIGFDTEPVDIIGPFAGADRERFIPQILNIAPGGGGIYAFESLVEARRVTQRSNRPNRFIILLADGSDVERQEGALDLVRSMQRDENTTLTVVSIGDGPDVPFLEGLAEAGRGRFHLTDRAANLPTIFSEEAALAQRSYIVEQEFVPARASDSPILAGIDAAPPLFGYIAVSEKEAAQVILRAVGGDPLLATWQYGLGRVAAFTSDATGRWAREWVRWPGFAAFWTQTTRWTILERPQSPLLVELRPRGEQTLVTASLPDSDAFRSDSAATLRAAFTDSAGRTFTQTLERAAPGQFDAVVDLAPAGTYFVRIAAEPETGIAPVQLPYAVPYSPEYTVEGGGEAELRAWAALGGGRLQRDPAEAWARGAPVVAARQDLAPWLLMLAALLLPFDVAVRRVGDSLRELLQRRRTPRTAERPAARRPTPQPPTPATAPIMAPRITPAQPPLPTASAGPRAAPGGAQSAAAAASDLVKRRRRES
jgi:uncharacterized membrane protein